MPTIPTYNANIQGGVVSQPRATADTTVASGVAKLGKTIGQIGTGLAEIRDRSDIVNAQLDFKEAVATYDKENEGDLDYKTMRERRETFMGDLRTQITQDMSDSAKRAFLPKLDLAIQTDKIRFDGTARKIEGVVNVAKIDAKKPLILNNLVYAASDQEVDSAMDEIDTVLESLRPHLDAGSFEKYKKKFLEEGFVNRAKRIARERGSLGQDFDPNDWTAKLSPKDIESVVAVHRKEYKHFETLQKAEARYGLKIAREKEKEIKKAHKESLELRDNTIKQLYTEHNDNWEANILENGFIDMSFPNSVKGLGGLKQYNALMEKADLLYQDHQVLQQAELDSDASILGTFDTAIESTKFAAGAPNAKSQRERRENFERLKSKNINLFKNDSWGYTAKSIPDTQGLSDEAVTGIMVEAQAKKGTGIDFKIQYFPTSEKNDILNRYRTGDKREKRALIADVVSRKGKFALPALASLGIGAGAIASAEALKYNSTRHVSDALLGAAETKVKDIPITPDEKKILDQEIAGAWADVEAFPAMTRISRQFPTQTEFSSYHKGLMNTFRKLVYQEGSVDKAVEIMNTAYVGFSDDDVGHMYFNPNVVDKDRLFLGMRNLKTREGAQYLFPKERIPTKLTDKEYQQFLDGFNDAQWFMSGEDKAVLVGTDGKTLKFGGVLFEFPLSEIASYSDLTPYRPESRRKPLAFRGFGGS